MAPSSSSCSSSTIPASTMTVGNMESVQLFDAGHKGRGLRATKELRRGDVVFAEASFSAVVFDRCVCLRLLAVLIYRAIFLLRSK